MIIRINSHIFRLAIALLAFIFGVGVHTGWRYFQSKSIRQNSAPSALAFEPQGLFCDVEQNITPQSKFDAFGYYYIANGAPKGFEDIDHVSVFTTDYEVNQDPYSLREISIPPEGNIWTGEIYKMTRLNLGNGQLSFATEMVRGISYQFSGRFLVGGDFYDLPQETMVLEGHLKKIRRGRTLAEADVQFTWYAGH